VVNDEDGERDTLTASLRRRLVEVAYFGLPQSSTRIGQVLLTWRLSKPGRRPNRIWLNNCTLDDPAAMSIFEARIPTIQD